MFFTSFFFFFFLQIVLLSSCCILFFFLFLSEVLPPSLPSVSLFSTPKTVTHEKCRDSLSGVNVNVEKGREEKESPKDTQSRRCQA